MAYISNALRQSVTARAQGLCDYCQTAQTIVIEMELDHIVPEAAGGATEAENLCLACISCNTFKSAYQTDIDPPTSEEVPLFKPRQQQWNEHFRWSEDGSQIVGTTAIGRATVARLQLNRSLVVQARRRWVQAGWHPPKTT
jgi:5-methylcytosine-specific restriction endonuclease McrA